MGGDGTAPLPPGKEAAEVVEACELLADQKKLLWTIYHHATEPPTKLVAKADLANFLLFHALHIHEMGKAALILVENGQPYAVVLVARSALESAFNLVAAVQNREFGPQRMAFELEELAKKLKLLLEKGAWFASRRPTPDECLREAARIRRDYSAATPTKRCDRDQIEKIERIAEAAGLSPFYDDDYRQLSLAVHSNQAGILNSASGFLVRKAMLALSNATFLANQVLCSTFRIKTYGAAVQSHRARLEALMKKPDFLPRSAHPPGEL
jgi:hypothetical protein